MLQRFSSRFFRNILATELTVDALLLLRMSKVLHMHNHLGS